MLRLNPRAGMLSAAAALCTVIALAGPANAAPEPSADPAPAAATDAASAAAGDTPSTAPTPKPDATDPATPTTPDVTPSTPDTTPTPDATPTPDPAPAPDPTPMPTPGTDATTPSTPVTPAPDTPKAPPAPTNSLTPPADQTSPVGTKLALNTDHTCPGMVCSWSATGLPPGLSYNPLFGVIVGTPTTAGNYTVTITATPLLMDPESMSFNWTVNDVVTIDPLYDQFDFTGEEIFGFQAYADQLDPTNTLTYSATGLPPGISLASDGEFSGTPTEAGDYAVQVTVTAKHGESDSATFTWYVRDRFKIGVDPIADQKTMVGHQVGIPISILAKYLVLDRGANGPFDEYQDIPRHVLSFTVSGLPGGITFNRDHMLLTGTPTVAGTHKVSVEMCLPLEDTALCDSADFTWTVTAPVTPPEVKPAPPLAKVITVQVPPKPLKAAPKPARSTTMLSQTGANTSDPLLTAFALIALGGCGLVVRRRLALRRR